MTTRSIGNISNSTLKIKIDSGKYYWGIEDDYYLMNWEEIPEYLYDALNSYEDENNWSKAMATGYTSTHTIDPTKDVDWFDESGEFDPSAWINLKVAGRENTPLEPFVPPKFTTKLSPAIMMSANRPELDIQAPPLRRINEDDGDWMLALAKRYYDIFPPKCKNMNKNS